MPENEYNSSFAQLPYSAEAEQAVLGAIILDSNVFDKVLDYVKAPEYFYVSSHKQIFEQMIRMMNFGESIDFVTLLESLKQNNTFDDATGKTYLMSLAENCPPLASTRAISAVTIGPNETSIATLLAFV